MELLVFVLIAGVLGYLLARSRFSKPIDESAKKVAETTGKAAKTTGGWLSGAGDWFRKTFKLGKQAKDEVVDVAEVKKEPAADAAPAAAKQPSRRKSEENKPE